MANTFQRQAISGGDQGVWGPIENAQNTIALSLNTAALYLDTAVLKLSKGNIGLDDDSQKGICVMDTVYSFSLVGLTASRWARIEISRTGTTINLAITSIAAASSASVLPTSELAAYDGEKGGYYLTATKRIIGFAWINAAGAVEGIVNFGHGDMYSGYSTSNDAFDNVYEFSRDKYTHDMLSQRRVMNPVITTLSTSQVIASTWFDRLHPCVAGTNGIRLELPTWNAALVGKECSFIKTDDANSAVTLFLTGGGTISGQAYIFLIEQWQKITLLYTDTGVVIKSGTLIADSGFVSRSDWTNVHIGTADITFDGKAGTFLIGELVKEATSNNTGIIVGQTATVLYIWRATGTGIWTNDRVITGQISLATANVNNASTTKNLDANFYHGFSVNQYALSNKLLLSTDNTNSNSFTVGLTGYYDGNSAGGSVGTTIYQVDTSSLKIQTAATVGFQQLIDNGTVVNIDAEDYYYRMIVKLII